MDTTASERALHRVLSYWRQSGITITADIERDALRLVTDVFASASTDPIDDCLKRVVQQMNEMPEAVPVVAPTLARTSLGYGEF